MNRPPADRLQLLFTNCLKYENPDDAIENLLSTFAVVADIRSFKLFVAKLDQARYVLQYRSSRKDGEVVESQLEQIKFPEPNSLERRDPILNALRIGAPFAVAVGESTRSPLYNDATQSVFLVPLARQDSQAGLLILESESAAFDWIAYRDVLAPIATTISLLLEKRAALGLLQVIQQPIKFSQPADEFLSQQLGLACKASGMRYAALRELVREGGQTGLRCLNLQGFETDDISTFDLFPLSDYPSFLNCVDRQTTVAEPDMQTEHLASIRTRPEVLSIRSFVVVPVRVGSNLFGCLSFGAEVPHVYSSIEKAGFETIANAVGVAISNFRNAEELRAITSEHTETGLTFTALEVAQAARHEARVHIDNAQSAIAVLKLAHKRARELPTGAEEAATLASAHVDEISRTIDKIRDASKVVRGERAAVSMNAVFREALVFAETQLNGHKVKIRMDGADAKVYVFPNLVRIALANLLLNSADAFKKKYRGRPDGKGLIGLRVEDKSQRDRHVTIRYYDNAGGLDVAALNRLVPEGGGRSIKEVVFERGVTTKEKGTGWGLYLVRRAVADCGGSVEMVDSKDGCVFDLTLPKYMDSRKA